MNTHTPTHEPASPAGAKPRKRLFLVAMPLVIIAAVVGISWILPPAWRPQLDVTNTGTTPVTLSYRDHTSVTEPGKTWSMRFSAGDMITIRTGEGANAATRTIQMPAQNPKPWSMNPTAQRWRADVHADDPKNIRFENRYFEEIRIPPSPPEPRPS